METQVPGSGISRNRATTAAADRNERHGYMNYIRRQATSIRAEGQALRQRARDLHVNQAIAFVNDGAIGSMTCGTDALPIWPRYAGFWPTPSTRPA